VVCALTAAKGVVSGSGAFILTFEGAKRLSRLLGIKYFSECSGDGVMKEVCDGVRQPRFLVCWHLARKTDGLKSINLEIDG